MTINLSETIRQAVAYIRSGKSLKGDADNLELQARFLETRFNPHIQGISSIIVEPHDNGFFANFLQVIDALVLKSPAASVYVDWSPISQARHFSYHTEGNLWEKLFHQLGEKPAQPGMVMKGRINPLLANVYRGIYWELPVFPGDRQAYSTAFAQVRLNNSRIENILEIHESKFKSKHVIGVHKRVSNPGTEAMQQDRIPGTAECLARLDDYIKSLDGDYLVYLATDDSDAAGQFTNHFGEKVLMIEDATRVTGGTQSDGSDNEIHTRKGGAEIRDAEDVIIDVWSLARADCLWHVNSSNIPLAASFINPTLPLFDL